MQANAELLQKQQARQLQQQQLQHQEERNREHLLEQSQQQQQVNSATCTRAEPQHGVIVDWIGQSFGMVWFVWIGLDWIGLDWIDFRRDFLFSFVPLPLQLLVFLPTHSSLPSAYSPLSDLVLLVIVSRPVPQPMQRVQREAEVARLRAMQQQQQQQQRELYQQQQRAQQQAHLLQQQQLQKQQANQLAEQQACYALRMHYKHS